MTVRRAQIGDEPVLRNLRLQALTDAPESFGSTYQREVARTVEDWRRWMSPGATFIYEDRGEPRGLVAGGFDAADDTIQLMAMWIHPDHRGSGGADQLVAALLAWAQSEHARVVRLDVIADNDRARRFYARNGFRATGHTRVRARDGGIELQMERVLAGSSP